MNKEIFKTLNKEQMIVAFSQLKDDYHNLFKQHEKRTRKYKKFKKDIVNKLNKIMMWDREELPKDEVIIEVIDTLFKEIEREKQYTDFYKDLCNKQQKVMEENKLEILSLKNKIFGYKHLYISKDKIREFIKEELPDDELMKWNIIYDVNGTDLRIKLEKMLEEK